MGYIDAPAGNPAFSTSSDLIPLAKIFNTVCSVAKHFASKPLNTYCEIMPASAHFSRKRLPEKRGGRQKTGTGYPMPAYTNNQTNHAPTRQPRLSHCILQTENIKTTTLRARDCSLRSKKNPAEAIFLKFIPKTVICSQ